MIRIEVLRVKVLILGATGMLGHKMMQVLSDRFDVIGTVRGSSLRYRDHPILGGMALLGDVQAENFDSVIKVVATTHADAVINCIGIVKQHPSAMDPLQSISVNALFPHRLAGLCRASGARLIQISTDCVFSGRKGYYTEDDRTDPEDLYGRTKLLGEVTGPGCLTLRTSMIGREIQGRLSLVEWFLSQRGKSVRGFAGVIYSGFTTQVLADLIGDIIERQSHIHGLWHVSSDPISKYDLLRMMNRELKLGIDIQRDGTIISNRSLKSARFREATGFKPPTWEEMIVRMAGDATPYDTLDNRRR